MLVSEGHEQGVIDDDERNMMNRVMRLGDRTADSLMTPRTRIAWLDAAATREDNLADHARYPLLALPGVSRQRPRRGRHPRGQGHRC
jgi:putative hemolysin